MFRLDDELVEDAVADPRCLRDCGADAFPSAGRGGEVEDLEKLGTGSDSTMIWMAEALLHRRKMKMCSDLLSRMCSIQKRKMDSREMGTGDCGYIRQCFGWCLALRLPCC